MNKCSKKPRGWSRQKWKTYAMETQKTSKKIERERERERERDNDNEKM